MTYTIDVHLSPDEVRRRMRADAIAGLLGDPKSIPPVWFYDERGSQLFEEITRLPEYYPTRAERRLLEAHAPTIAELSKADTLVELGAGSCEKTRVLLSALQQLRHPGPLRPLRRERRVPPRRCLDPFRGVRRRSPSIWSSVISASTWRRSPPMAGAWWPSWAARSATSTRPGGPGSSSTSTAPCRATTPCSSAPTWSRTARGWWRPTTMRPA